MNTQDLTWKNPLSVRGKKPQALKSKVPLCKREYKISSYNDEDKERTIFFTQYFLSQNKLSNGIKNSQMTLYCWYVLIILCLLCVAFYSHVEYLLHHEVTWHVAMSMQIRRRCVACNKRLGNISLLHVHVKQGKIAGESFNIKDLTLATN